MILNLCSQQLLQQNTHTHTHKKLQNQPANQLLECYHSTDRQTDWYCITSNKHCNSFGGFVIGQSSPSPLPESIFSNCWPPFFLRVNSSSCCSTHQYTHTDSQSTVVSIVSLCSLSASFILPKPKELFS